MESRIDSNDAHATAQEVAELVCNIDDMTGEEIGFAMDVLLEQGALEVFTTSVGMKKGRPGIMLTVIARLEDAERLSVAILKQTSTIGVRKHICERMTLTRSFDTIKTDIGDVRVKISEGFGITKAKLEYEDLQKIARENDLSIREARGKVQSLIGR